MDDQESEKERVFREILWLKKQGLPDLPVPDDICRTGAFTPFHCCDCNDAFKDEINHRRSQSMPWLCETCAEYRQGGY